MLKRIKEEAVSAAVWIVLFILVIVSFNFYKDTKKEDVKSNIIILDSFNNIKGKYQGTIVKAEGDYLHFTWNGGEFRYSGNYLIINE